MPAARPMTRGRCESIQEVISLPTEPPSHTPFVMLVQPFIRD
jgi:hypothetical protein